MKKTILITFLFAFASANIMAQGKENNNWFFGGNAGLTWNTLRSFQASVIDTTKIIGYDALASKNDTTLMLPTSIASSINTNEGCFSLSDFNTGKVLFYSDGINVWNQNNEVMPNGSGLSGSNSSAQSGIIIPYPGAAKKYIAFTLGERDANDLRYSVVDMNLEEGLGDVDLSQKNVSLTGAKGILGESLTAVRHKNKKDFWIIAVGRSESNGAPTYLNVWEVTSAGVNVVLHSDEVISGFNTFSQLANPNGYITFANDGSRFAYSNFDSPNAFVFGKFDNTIGEFTYIKQKNRNYSYYYGYGYGVEFSKSGKYLYLSFVPAGKGGNYGSSLYVYDFDELLAASDPANVSRVNRFYLHNGTTSSLPADGTNGHFGSLAMGSDGYIYATDFYTRNMYVIINPEKPQAIKMYKLENFLAEGSEGRWGLPTFTAPYFRVEILAPVAPLCMDDKRDYEFRIIGGIGIDDVEKIVFNFGDGKPSSIITLNAPIKAENIIAQYSYKYPGTYNITAKVYAADGNEITSSATSTTVTINSCHIKVNPHIRSIYEGN